MVFGFFAESEKGARVLPAPGATPVHVVLPVLPSLSAHGSGTAPTESLRSPRGGSVATARTHPTNCNIVAPPALEIQT
jgi:hypothetical protein